MQIINRATDEMNVMLYVDKPGESVTPLKILKKKRGEKERIIKHTVATHTDVQ